MLSRLWCPLRAGNRFLLLVYKGSILHQWVKCNRPSRAIKHLYQNRKNNLSSRSHWIAQLRLMSHQSQWPHQKPPRKPRTESRECETSCINRRSSRRKSPKRKWWVWHRGAPCHPQSDRAQCTKGSMDLLWGKSSLNAPAVEMMMAPRRAAAGKPSRRRIMTSCSGRQRAPRSTNSWRSSASSRLNLTWTLSSSSRRIGIIGGVGPWLLEASLARRRSLGRKNRASVDNKINNKRLSTTKTWAVLIWLSSPFRSLIRTPAYRLISSRDRWISRLEN